MRDSKLLNERIEDLPVETMNLSVYDNRDGTFKLKVNSVHGHRSNGAISEISVAQDSDAESVGNFLLTHFTNMIHLGAILSQTPKDYADGEA